MHVTIGANSWVTEKIPRAADVAASFENREGSVGAELFKVVRGANARNTGPYDDDVMVLSLH